MPASSSQTNIADFLETPNQPPNKDNSVGITLGDIDNDRDLDAFVINYNNQKNQLLLNDGSGNFVAAPNQPIGSSNSNDVALGDVDNDGDLDAFVVNNWQPNQLLLNDGHGNFMEAPTQPKNTDNNGSYGISLGDIDSDGDLDAFIVNYWGQSNQLLLNNGNGVFTEASSSLPGNSYSQDVALGDLDGDSDLDAFVVNYSNQANQVLLNDGYGRFTEATLQPPGSKLSTGVSLGDIDSDGDLDAFVTNYKNQPNQLLLNDGTGNFTEALNQPPNSRYSNDISLGDLDNDGDLDAFVVNYGKTNQVLLNDGNGNFSEAVNQPPAPENSYDVSLGDLDGDGDLDSFVANFRQTSQVLLNGGTHYRDPEPLYREGTFVVQGGDAVTVEFLFDGGGFNKGELGIFNLSGMENFELGSEAFLQEAARRATSSSALGHVVIQDKHQAARFDAEMDWERDFNSGTHSGKQTFAMNAGDQFALILSQNISLGELANDPAKATKFGRKAIFSIPEANSGTRMASQILDINGLGTEGRGVFGMEDLLVNVDGSDRDYNDIVFQIEGATSLKPVIKEGINPRRDWTETSVGQGILDYSTQTFDSVVQGSSSGDVLLGDQGNNLLEGFKGQDILVGGMGQDILTGGRGKDIFVLEENESLDIITDFTLGQDLIGLSDGMSFGALTFSGSDILLQANTSPLATLSGVDTTTLTATDFVLM
ncbi:FG-GAP-like repeat-containing protein [Leptothoe sp. ISB3NOV94-8A]